MRGLKLCISGLVTEFSKSHPSRVRGLKSLFLLVLLFSVAVAPFAGAWIEIGYQPGDLTAVCGRTLRGCVD